VSAYRDEPSCPQARLLWILRFKRAGRGIVRAMVSGRRAGRGRRLSWRWSATVTAGALVAVVVVATAAVAVNVLRPSGVSSRLSAAGAGRRPPVASPSPSAKAFKRPLPKHPRNAVRKLAPTPRRSPRKTVRRHTCQHGSPDFGTDCRDGKPGWFDGETICQGVNSEPSYDLPKFLKTTLDLPSTIPAGRTVRGRVSIRNISKNRFVYWREMTAPHVDAWLDKSEDGGYQVPNIYESAVHVGVTVWPTYKITLDPGETDSFPVTLHASQCADTSEQSPPPMRRGTYLGIYTLQYSPDNYHWSYEAIVKASEITVT
jgi:hypothetical protein